MITSYRIKVIGFPFTSVLLDNIHCKYHAIFTVIKSNYAQKNIQTHILVSEKRHDFPKQYLSNYFYQFKIH